MALDGRIFSRRITACALLAICSSLSVALADDLRARAAGLGDRAFALLGTVNVPSHETGPNPLLGPIASFAGDAQSLSKALAANDKSSAAAAVAALESDRAAVDAELTAHPSLLSKEKWQPLAKEADEIAKILPPSTATPGTAAASGTASSAPANDPAPKIKIDSATAEPGDILHFKGMFEGRNLKSGGIYRDGRRVKVLDVKKIPGMQRVNFDIQLASVQSGTSIRITDGEGRAAEEMIPAPAAEGPTVMRLNEDSSGIAADAERRDKMIELGPSGVTSSGAGVVAEPATPLSEPSGPDASETGSNTAEIPSNNPPSPTKAHIKSHKHDRFGDIQVTIANLQETDPMLHEYQVSGQIAGTGIERAGIFVDGRPAGDIAVGSSGGFATSSFNQGFVFNGHEATIRVFGPHNNYMESSLRTGGVGGPVIAASGNPNQLAIQITGVQPVSSMVSNLSGTVSGKNIQSAGLFQNGVMVQSIAVAGGLLSTFAPSVYHSVNFNAQFNPGGGPAMVRVFDTAGNFVDQPVNGIVAGRFGYGTGTYSGVNPYGGGVNPYGNANPGYSGYNMNPNPRPPAYGSPYSSTPPSSPGSKWWNRYLY